MNWSTPAELKAQLLRRWERGDLLRAYVLGEPLFPLALRCKVPTSAQITAQFKAVAEWVASLKGLPLRIEWREFRHGVMGLQRLPETVHVDHLDAALAWLGKTAEFKRFDALLALTRERQPALLRWLARSPLQALELAPSWTRLLDVVDWVRARPRPACYLRQVDVPGVHSKLIEAHRGVLAEWLDLVLPAQAIDTRHSAIGGFNARYGFLDKPVRIRFRPLDPTIVPLPGLDCPDVTLDAASFARLALPVRSVFITENETNFLAFPPMPGAIVLFGAGYGWEALGQARWLHDCHVHYWGDIDTHGFAILDQLRAHLPNADSLLMDRATLMAHEAFWENEPKPVRHDLHRLTAEEWALFTELRDGRIRAGLRLEQERVRFGYLQRELGRLLAEGAAT